MAAVAAGAVIGVVNPIGVSPAAAAAVNIRLININDFHGRIDANTVKFAGTVEQVKAAAPTPGNTLFGAAGDLVGASLFASAVQNDDPTIDVLNALQLQTSSVGNHEFDKGFNDLTTHLEPRANWTYLCANCYNAGTETAALPEYQVFTFGKVTVGVIGAVTQETGSLVSPGGVANLTFGDPVAAVNRVATQLSDGNDANGEAAIIVAEYHEGANSAPTAAPFNQATNLSAALAEPTFEKIAKNTSALVDVIFNGHTHKTYRYDVQVPGAAPGITRPIVQTGNYGDFVGVVDLVVEDTTGAVASYSSALVPRIAVPAGKTSAQFDQELAAGNTRVAQVKSVVEAAIAKANEIGATPIARVTGDITTAFSGGTYTGGLYTGGTRDDRARESTLGNLVADSILASLEDPLRGGAEIAVTNPGGLRDELLIGNDGGVITFAEANAVVPFANTLNTITLTGAQVKTLLEQQWQRNSAGAIPSRPYLQLGVSKNLTYTFDPTRAEGDRITSINVNGAPIDPAREYRVGAFSFLIEGGDNFHVFRSGTSRRDSGLIDRDAFIAYLTENSPISPDFARRSVQITPAFPTNVAPGQVLSFTVSNLDLTSLGSPQNTALDVFVGGTVIGTVPVTNGTAIVSLTVPAALATGSRALVLVARPTGTLVNGRTLYPFAPTRLFDTRGPAESPNVLRTVPVAKVGGDNVLQVKATDLLQLVPQANVGAVSLNVAVTNPEAAGFVTVYPCGTRELVASVNYVRGETVSNAVVAPVSIDGNICFYSLVPTDIVVDINGWFDSGFSPIKPSRVFDTRGASESPDALRTVAVGKVSGDPPLEVKLTDLGTSGSLVPGANVGAVSINVAVTNPAQDGFVSVYPCGDRSLIANVNYLAGQTVSNAVVVPVSATGTLCFYSLRAADIVVDINGWLASSSAFRGVTPSRVFDTRAGQSPNALVNVPKVKVGPPKVLEVKVTGLTGLVPDSGVGMVALNVAVTNPEAPGYVTVFPCGDRQLTASANYVTGETVSNLVLAPVSSTGTVCFYSYERTDLVVDINGWFAG